MTAATDPADVPEDAEISREEAEELVKELERRRTLRGVAAVAVSLVGISFSLFQLFLAAQGFSFEVPLPVLGTLDLSLQLLQANAVHVVFALVLAFLLFPASTGDGLVVNTLGRTVPAVRHRLGADNPVTRGVVAVRGVARWLVLDPDRERVTPVDLVAIATSVLAGLYFLTDFREIRDMRVFGLDAGRPVQEVFPILEPILGGVPIVSEYSYAFLLGVLGVLLVLEATRRTMGLPLMVLAAMFIVYARWGHLISGNTPIVGVLAITELSWPDIVQNLWYNTENGVFGIPVTVSVQFIYIFILFGAFLEMSGAGQWFIDLAYSITGRRKGGPAKASILASGFMGTISGSSIANTVTTGAFTIPLMKRSGYSPEFSGAVESSASSGGQILPPVMGAAIFIMVQYTATPLPDLIIVATIPAVVFFFGVWVMVHFKATRENIGGITDTAAIVDMREHFARGWFYLVPIVLLLYYLIVARLSVSRAAWFTVVALLALVTAIAAYSRRTRGILAASFLGIVGVEFLAYVVAGAGVLGIVTGSATAGVAPGVAVGIVAGKIGWYLIAAGVVTLLARPAIDATYLELDPAVQEAAEEVGDRLDRPSFADNQLARLGTFVLKSMDEGARTAVPVVIAVAAAGIIPGVISVSGLGPNLTSLLRELSGGSIVLLLLITAIAAIILGMGMPTTVTYIILASMLTSPLITFGIPELAAHLYILYFGVIADITPPVAVAAYAAAGVAKSDPYQTGVKAFSLSLNKAIVPFAFVFVPGIILLREKANAAELPLRDSYRLVGFSDLADLSYSVPEVIVPIAGVFLGVVALAATVIGTMYTSLSRFERAGFALSALLLMAPALLLASVFDLLSLAGLSLALEYLQWDLELRVIGFVLFALLAFGNRSDASTEPAGGEDVTATSPPDTTG